jgi:branched-chain amino acid transport system substrate-binding protein
MNVAQIWRYPVKSMTGERLDSARISSLDIALLSRLCGLTQVLEAMQRAGTTDTAALIKALEGHEFDGLKEGHSYYRS